MYSKISDLITTISVLVFLAAILALANSCEPDERFRGPNSGIVIDSQRGVILTEDGRVIRQSARGGLSYTTAGGRLAYVLSSIHGARSTAASTVPTGPYSSRSGRTPSMASPTGSRSIAASSTRGSAGTSGEITLVKLYDSSEISDSRADLIRKRSMLTGNSHGVGALPTKRFSTVSGISEDSYIDVTPDGKSLLVSSPNSNSITQFVLDERTGEIIKRIKIDFCPTGFDARSVSSCAKPTRFIAMRDFTNNPYVFVATDKGIHTLKFDLDEGLGARVGRVYGARQSVSYTRSRDIFNKEIKVFDVAISADNQMVYIATADRNIHYKSTSSLIAQLDEGGVWQQSFAERIHAPMTLLPTMPPETVAILTRRGVDFLNMANRDTSLKWGRMGSVNPLDLSWSSDGYSMLVLTSTAIFRFPLTDAQIGEQVDMVPIGSGAVDFAIDKRKGMFLAIAHRGTVNSTMAARGEQGYVSLARLDEGGIVSQPGADDWGPVPGSPIALTVR